jgi:Holliday junction resolvase RusA-like endonuclease
MYDAPVLVSLVFTFTRPKYHFNKHGIRPGAPLFKQTKPDLDKLCRAVLDALTESGVLRDDCLVVSLIASKLYGENPGVLVRVTSQSEAVEIEKESDQGSQEEDEQSV